MSNLEKVHPQYQRYLQRYYMISDFLIGGMEVLKPAHYRENASFLTPVKSTQSDSDGLHAGTETKYEWTTVPQSSYLFTHQREKYEHWKMRAARLVHLPIAGPILSILVDGVIRNPPSYSGETDIARLPDEWKEFFNDSTGAGDEFNSIKAHVLLQALGFGRYHTAVHVPGSKSESVSAYHQQAEAGRPYLQLISPLAAKNWSMDRSGNYRWIIVDQLIAEDTPVGDEHSGEVEKLVITTHGNYTYRKTKRGWFRHGEHWEHNFGRAMLSTMSFNRRIGHDGSPISDAPLGALFDIDRGVLNKLSLLDQIDYNQTFSQIVLPGTMAGSGVDIGMFNAIIADMKNGSPYYMSPDAQQAAGLWVRIKELIQLARTIGSVSRGMADVSKEARSMKAIHFESDEKYTKMSKIAQAAERWERQTFNLIEAATGKSPLAVEYPKQFDVMAIDSKLAAFLELVSAQVDEAALQPIAKSVIGEIMKRVGADPKEQEAALEVLKSGKFLQMQSMQQESGSDSGEKDASRVPSVPS